MYAGKEEADAFRQLAQKRKNAVATQTCAPSQHDVSTVATGEKHSRSRSYKGVHKSGKRWRVRCYLHGERREVGSFTSAELAAEAYDKAVIESYRLDVGQTNFPLENYMYLFEGAMCSLSCATN